MRKPPPSIKLYPCPRGFERVTLDAYHVRAMSSEGEDVSIRIGSNGFVRLGFDPASSAAHLTPGEAYALAQALIEASAYATPLYVKPRVRVRSQWIADRDDCDCMERPHASSCQSVK